MSNRYDAIVIGIGAMGSAACWELARRGVRVLGLEQFEIGHSRGSSHGLSRMIRMAYYEHPDYVPLLRRAYALWDDLETATGERVLFRTGGVYMGPPDGGVVAGSLASARQHGLAHEHLSADALRERHPQFRIPGNWQAVLEAAAGFLLPERAIHLYARLARAAGATLLEQTPVLGWTAHRTSGELIVSTAGGEFVTRQLIVCGGAWSGRLLADLAVPLIITRQVLGWVKPADTEPFALGKFPVWASENPDGTLLYGFPIQPGETTLKVAWHGPGTPTDPDTVSRQTSAADAATFLPALPHLLPDAVGPVQEMRVCMYTNSPDHHFILDRHPRDPRITVACGFSGHGFKFASVIGELLARTAIHGHMPPEADFLSISRFKQLRNV
jgi:sarcosine oxidase